jgi:hypothetical protein
MTRRLMAARGRRGAGDGPRWLSRGRHDFEGHSEEDRRQETRDGKTIWMAMNDATMKPGLSVVVDARGDSRKTFR